MTYQPYRYIQTGVDVVALTLKCPRRECGRPPSQMCVYTTAPAGSGRQIGQPMRNPHAERRAAASRKISRQQIRRSIRLVPGDRRPATRAHRQAAAAEREFDRREWEQMRDWLRVHGEILWRERTGDLT